MRLKWPWSKPNLTPMEQSQADLLKFYEARKWQHYSPQPYICPLCDKWACFPYREAYYYTTVIRQYRYPPGLNDDEVNKFYPSRLYLRGR